MKQYDLPLGRAARDEGIESVASHNPEWIDLAIIELQRLPRGWRGLPEDWRPLVELVAGEPTKPNAWGALTRLAVVRGLMRATGQRRQMRRVKSHARKTDEYERA